MKKSELRNIIKEVILEEVTRSVVDKLNSLSMEEIGELYLNYDLDADSNESKEVLIKRLLDTVHPTTLRNDLRDIN